MIQIRPVSDLRNTFPKIEDLVVNQNQTVYLTKNGYGSMVLMSLEKYEKLVGDIEEKLDYADKIAEETDVRYTHDEVFSNIRRKINEK